MRTTIPSANGKNYRTLRENISKSVHRNIRFEELKLNEALEEISKALAIRPDYAKAHNNIGNIYLKKGELDKAILHYKQSLEIKNDYGKSHHNLAYAYYLKGNYALALVHADKAVALGINRNSELLEFLNAFR